MKIYIWCYLFGHKWRYATRIDGALGTLPCDECAKCGLTKEDVFKS